MKKTQSREIMKTRKSRKRIRRNIEWKKKMIAVGVLLAVTVMVIIGKYVGSSRPAVVWSPGFVAQKDNEGGMTASNNERGEAETDTGEENTALQWEAVNSAEVLAAKQEVINSYSNLGIVDVNGYLNVRQTADASGDIIGRLQQYSACDILKTEGEWYQIRSGEVEGFINSQYILTGEAAKERAFEQIKLMAVITADSVNVRSGPVLDPMNVIGAAGRNGRYEVLSQSNDWIQLNTGYISASYAEVRYALNEARKLDLKTMALNQYENLVISKVNNYLNVRSSPENSGDSNVIGKLPGRAAAEILETTDGWYKIRSGSITGYITSDAEYTATGQEARDLALQSASLMAVVSTERLNVRIEPNTDSNIWTQISQEERYPVLQQMDGWVQIELDTAGEDGEIGGAYVSTRENNVEVRYALAEAIKFLPLEIEAGEERSLRNQVANYAVQFVGNPYVWGGTSLTNGADCSGFVLSVMKNFGVSLPRTSREQSRSGTEVSSSDMLPGDLVFYANGSGTINHVSMYIGNGQVVHASSRRTGIKISTWNYRTPKTIRRVL